VNKHTPGPWEAEDYLHSGDWRSTGLIWSKAMGDDCPWIHIATMNWSKLGAASDPTLIAEVEANTRLIAAAPDLLFALEEAMWAVKHRGHMQQDHIAATLGLMRQAIARAKGDV